MQNLSKDEIFQVVSQNVHINVAILQKLQYIMVEAVDQHAAV